MLYPILSLVFLAVAIAIGCIFKKNTGIVSIALALILARIASVPDKFLLNAFDSSLFIKLLGVMFLFCVAQNNQTLEIIAKKAILLCRGKVKLIPIVLFFFSAIISFIGPGLISATALVSVLAIALAIEADVEPMKFLFFGGLGAFAGGLSPITPSGIVAITKSEQSGIVGIEFSIAFFMFIIMLLIAIILYFFVFKWHKYDDSQNKKTEISNNVKFEKKHLFTIIGIILVSALSTIFSVDIGLISFLVAIVLCIFGFGNEAEAMKKIPWNTLIMIAGVGMLISLVTELGGVQLLSDGIKLLMGEQTAAAIITILAGIMSWVSSASGVVMPTLIPTVPALAASAGVSPVALVTGICIGANAAAFSPLSSCGGLMLSAYSTSKIATEKGRDKLFSKLFLLSACSILITALIALIGCFNWFV